MAMGVGPAFGEPLSRRTERAARTLLLHGPARPVEVRFPYGRTGQERRGRFDGVLPGLAAQYAGASAERKLQLRKWIAVRACAACGRSRLAEPVRSVAYRGHTVGALSTLPLGDLLGVFAAGAADPAAAPAARMLAQVVRRRLGALCALGLEHLHLGRSADTLAAGEARRVRLAAQLGAGLRGVMYVLDEPSIGLHPDDHGRLLSAIRDLRDAGNTGVVVGHEEAFVRAADHLIDPGPGAGRHGGRIVAQGGVPDLETAPDSRTGAWLTARLDVAPPPGRPALTAWLRVRGARGTTSGTSPPSSRWGG